MALVDIAARERREKRLYTSIVLAGAFTFLSSNPVAFQDSLSLIEGEGALLANRWTARIVASPDGPAIVAASAAGGGTVRLAAIDPTITGALGAPTRFVQPVNRRLKGDRVDRRASMSAGALYVLDDMMRPGTENDLPRTAFALPAALATTAIAAATEKEAAKPVELASLKQDAKAQAYADPGADGATAKKDNPFNAVIATPKEKPSIAAKPDATDHFWMAFAIPNNARSKTEQKCLAEAIYFEARGEPERGQQAVAQVVINRLKNPAYPGTICGVVYQNRHKRNACQFSFACDGIPDRITDQGSWKTAQEIARKMVNGEATFLTDVGSSTHYHATYVRPRWARQMKKMQKIGRHVFYKTYGGGWI